MASDTITGSRYGSTSNGPYLQLHWNEVERDIAGNRTKVRLTLRFRSDASYGINYTFHNRTGYLQGESYTYSGRASGSSVNLVLRQRDVWIAHNSNGTRTVTFSGDIRSLGLNFSGNNIGTMAVSGPVTLTPIPRGSTLNSFSFSNALQIGTSNTITYSVTKHASSYRNRVRLYDGAVLLQTWDNQNTNGTGNTVTVASSVVDAMLGRMSTVTSKTYTLRIDTRAGTNGGFIGSASTATASVSVNANVTPTINSTSVTPTGNSWAVNKGLYVHGQTGVQAEFSSTARGGAGVKSRSISIGGLSTGGSVVGSVFRHSHSRVNITGEITITYRITDTRDRTVSSSRKINFSAYTPPQITSFRVGRSSPTSSTVNIRSQGSIHGIGGHNTGTMTITREGVSGNIQSMSLNNTTPSFNDSFSRTVATSASASFTITVTDALGNSARSASTVGTAFMELSIRKGTGVGIGKIHENGVLDVDGQAYFSGRIEIDGADPNTIKINTHTDADDSYISWYNNVGARKGWMGFGSTGTNDITVYNDTGDDVVLTASNGGKVRVGNSEIIGSGNNSNGYWVQFYDGTQICFRGGAQYTTGANTMHEWSWEFPKAFDTVPTIMSSAEYDTGARKIYSQVQRVHKTGVFGRMHHDHGSSLPLRLGVLAIGWWK